MNKTVLDFLKKEIKTGLLKLPANNQAMFKRMYSPDNLNASVEDAVENMPIDKMDWALQQVENTLTKLGIKKGDE